MSTENVRDRDIWISSDSDYPILICARSDNAGRRHWDLLSQERALKRDEPWKILVLCPIARDGVAGFDGRQFRFNFASVYRIGASGVEAATMRGVYR